MLKLLWWAMCAQWYEWRWRRTPGLARYRWLANRDYYLKKIGPLP